MGYRHQVISDTMVKYLKLPEWFLTKYEGWIDFSRDYWASYGEGKRYGIFKDLETDIQKVIRTVDPSETVRLVFFADESDYESPDISHVTITANEITEIRPTGWVKEP